MVVVTVVAVAVLVVGVTVFDTVVTVTVVSVGVATVAAVVDGFGNGTTLSATVCGKVMLGAVAEPGPRAVSATSAAV